MVESVAVFVGAVPLAFHAARKLRDLPAESV
jgi:hypothetical protein